MILSRQKRRLVRSGAAFWLIALLTLSLSPSSVYAHAGLIRSEPKANANLKHLPKLVELWFNEELEPNLNTIEVKDRQGQRVDKGAVTLSEENKKAQVELGELAAGAYTVEWKAVSADQHTIRGNFTFALEEGGAASATPPLPAQEAGAQGAGATAQPSATPESAPQTAASADEISWAQTVIRWLSYLVMMMLFGGFAFRLLVLAPALRRATAGSSEGVVAVAASERCALALSWASVILLALTTLIALVMQASAMFDKTLGEALSPALLARVITETGYGGSWVLQALSVVVLIIILSLLGARIKRSPSSGEHAALWWAGLVVGAVLLVAPSWTGHATAAIKHFRLAVFSDWLHLLAGGFWVGGLFHLALTWPPALPLLTKTQRTRSLHHVIRLFTRVAMPSVALLVLAGLYNTWAHVPRIQALWMTPYGKTLALKLMLVGLMLLLGGLHNFYYGKRAAALEKAEVDDSQAHDGAKLERGFSRSVALEAGIGLLVLLVTAVLVFMTPARNHPAMDQMNAGTGVVQQQR